MAPAQPLLDAALLEAPYQPAALPVVANVDASPHTDGWAALLGAQLCSPVRWRESVLRLSESGVTRVIELGPGAVLGGMVKRITPELERACLATPADFEALTG
jgi:[acyl-carrier-protein] S-malonyltransferase